MGWFSKGKKKAPDYSAQIQRQQQAQAQRAAQQKAADDARYAKFQQDQAKAAADQTAKNTAAQKLYADTQAKQQADYQAKLEAQKAEVTANNLRQQQAADARRAQEQAAADARTAAAQAEADRLAKEKADNTNKKALDEMYSQRDTHVNTASKEIDGIIMKEKSKAAVSGVEFTMTPEQRTQRINEQLGMYRSTTDDQKILDLHSKYSDYASSKGYSNQFLFSPGAKKESGKAPTSVDPAMVMKPPSSTLLSEETEDPKKLKTILG